MPLGNQRFPRSPGSGVPVHGTVVPVPPGALAPSPPSLAERQAGAEAWKHVTLDNTAAVWPGGAAEVDFSTDSDAGMRVIEVYSGAGDVLFLAFDRPVGPGVGSYDLFTPGKGYLVERVPFVKRLYICTANGVAPLARVEVIGTAGSYTL